MKTAIVGATAITALLGILLSVEHFFDREHYNPGFAEFPVVTGLHVAAGALYLVLALAQLSPRIRGGRPSLHRWGGRVAVLAGLVSGTLALCIAALFPYSGPAELAVVGPFAGLFVYSLARGLWLARRQRYRQHREWMIRAMAVATSIATMRLLFVPAMVLLGGSEETARWLSLSCFGAAFLLHSASAELWIHASRSPRPAMGR